MSGLCGWLGFDGEESERRRAIERMALPLSRFDQGETHVAANGRSAVASSGRHGAVARSEDGLLVGVSGRIKLRSAELQAKARSDGVAKALASAYRQYGTELLELIDGAFALAIIDVHADETLLAIDRAGICPLIYAVAGEALVFGSSADAINLYPSVKSEIDPQSIYNYLYFHMVPGPATVFSGQRRLLPGQFLLFRGGKAVTKSYWEMRFDEHCERPFAELKQDFLTVLRESVRAAAEGADTGAFLSGGTDSSTIAGMLGEVTGKPARTYSIGFEAEGYDEMAYARIAARHFGTVHHEYYVTPDNVVAAIPQIAAAHDQPFGNASAVPTYYCAKLAKADGIETLLGGDGGDELFGGNERYAKQHLYSLYSDLPSSVRKGLIEPVAFALPEGIDVVGKVQRYIRNASQPMPGRYDNYNLLERLGAANVFTAEFLATVDAQQPRAVMARAYQQAHAETLINRMLALDLKYTLADNDLPKVTRSCELAGVDVQYPMLDDAVVAFSARLAPGLKLKGTRLRYFFKQALRGFLPDEIIVKEKHGFGLPFGPWLASHAPLRQIALDSVADLKQRHIVRADFIDELTSTHVRSHAGYYGTMVWILMMLEQWFSQHRPPA